MKDRINKLIAHIVCIAMCLQLLPALPAKAASGDLLSIDNYDSVDAAILGNADTPLLILQYHEPHSVDNDTDYARIDFGEYHIPDADLVMDFRLKYDINETALATWINGTVAPLAFKTAPPTSTALNAPNAVLIPKTISPDIVSASGQSMIDAITADHYWVNSDAGITSADWGFLKQPDHSGATITIGTDGRSFTGEYGFTLTTLMLSATKDFKDYYSIISQDEEGNITTANYDSPLFLASTYFVPDKIDYDTFKLEVTEGGPNGAYAALGNLAVATKVVGVGFPPAPETTYPVTFTIKATDTPMPNAVLSFTGTSAGGTDISGNYIPEAARTTGADGTVTVDLPASPQSGSYKLFISNASAGDKTYTMPGKHQGGFSFTVGAANQTCTYTEMEELTASYPVKLEFKDTSGNAVDLTGATLKLGSRTVIESEILDGVANFSTATSGALPIQLSGVKGFRDLTGDTTQINVTPVSGSTTNANLSVGSIVGTTAKKVEASQDGKTITVTLARSLTNVSIPIPIPQNGMTVEQARALQLTFTPKNPTTQTALVNEIGASGITVKGDAITVTSASARVAGDLAGSITAVAPLPDGAYDMEIGGVGFDGKSVPVTVLTDYSKTPYVRIANVGGTPTIDANGNVTSIADGVTATKEDAAAGQSDGAVSLVGKTADADGTGNIVEGGTTTVGGDGTITPPQTGGTGVTDITTGGLNDSTVADKLTPSVVTDPVYAVEVDTSLDSGLYKTMTVKVYLENKAASAGTIGLYFDPEIFDFAGLTKDAIALSDVEFSSLTSMSATTDPEIGENFEGANYIAFGWSVAAGKEPINPSTERKLLATITVPVKAAVRAEATLLQTIDNRSVYTMDFMRTATGKALAQKAGNNVTALNTLVGSAWRKTDMDGAADSIHLSAEAATRGGFYQINTTNAAGDANVMHDIRMRFKLPDFVTLQRADFYVSERNGTPGIDNATINLYETAYDPEATPPVEPLATATTADGGYAKFSLAGDKDYFYTVTEPGHWDYPDGTAETASDGLFCDQFTLTAEGAVMKGKIVMDGGDRKATPIRNGCINPQMDPQAYHAVDLLDDSADTPKAPPASITSPAMAYNGVTYYFTITPDAGKEWKLDAGEDMGKIAGELKATLHTVNSSASNVDDAFQNTTDATKPAVKWDANKEQFYIEGSSIKGDSIKTDKVNGTTVDPLRAGDIIITVPTSRLKDANYTITATAGKGGTVAYKLDTSIVGGDTDKLADVEATAGPFTIKEELSEGRTTSGKFTFKPDPTNKIDRVVVNGVEIAVPDEQKKTSFTYQFTNISSSQSIYVSFVDKDGNQLSAPYVKVIVGKGGTAALTATGATPAPDSITGPGNAEYTLTDATAFSAVLTPDTSNGYELDTVLIDGVSQDITSSKVTETGFYTEPYTASLDLADGDTRTIVVTFKPQGKPSTHAIVTSKVAYGLGALTPVGVNIYTVGSTPTYTMTPQEDWTVSSELKQKHPAILLDAKDKSDGVKEVKGSDGTGTNVFTYTLPALTGNVKLDVSFAEVGYEVAGKIRTAAKRAANTEIVPATLTFKRAAEEGKVDETIIEVTSDKTIASVSGDSKFAYVGFSDKIPKGIWSVTVQKPGYLTYTITEFEVKKGGTHTIYFGDATCDGGNAAGNPDHIKEIPLTAGDAAGDGVAIEFGDVSMVVAGWIKTPLPGNRAKADIDESGFGSNDRRSDISDMALVQNNLYELYVTDQKYSEFCGSTPSV